MLNNDNASLGGEEEEEEEETVAGDQILSESDSSTLPLHASSGDYSDSIEEQHPHGGESIISIASTLRR